MLDEYARLSTLTLLLALSLAGVGCEEVSAVGAPSCADGVQNGAETDVDCGGPDCEPCPNETGCDTDADCESGVCEEGVCVGQGCTDGVANGDETDIDCGGPDCDPCADGQDCLVGADCDSGYCDPVTNTCATASCADGATNGDETDTDCGGPDCPACSDGGECLEGSDCESGVCDPATNTCAAPSCADGVHNGSETDTDCGGADCGGCPIGGTCVIGADCANGVCEGGSCVPAIDCQDLLLNGGATADGAYPIDPDGSGGAEDPFEVYCDMTTDGGGWTLILKTEAGDHTLWYGSYHWAEVTSVLNEGDVTLSPGVSKYMSYNAVPFAQVRGCVNAASTNCVYSTFASPYANAVALFDGPETYGGVDAGAFYAVFGPSGMQRCAAHEPGFNIRANGGNYARWGFANNIPSELCQSLPSNDADAVIGFGIDGEDCGETGAGWTKHFVSSDSCGGAEASLDAWIWVRAADTCADGVLNGGEVDVDCGGPLCPRCEIGQNCDDDADCLSNNCAADNCDFPPGVVAWYRFEGSSGAVVDESPHALDGAATGGVTRGVLGHEDNAFHYDGAHGTGVGIADDPAFSFGTTLTVEAWINPSNCAHVGSNHNTVVVKEAEFLLAFRSTCYIANYVHIGGWVGHFPTYQIVPGVWQHVAMTYDGLTLRSYHNGLEVESGTAAIGVVTNAASSVFIGHRPGANQTFEGIIDEVWIWDEACTEQEICEGAGGVYDADGPNCAFF